MRRTLLKTTLSAIVFVLMVLVFAQVGLGLVVLGRESPTASATSTNWLPATNLLDGLAKKTTQRPPLAGSRIRDTLTMPMDPTDALSVEPSGKLGRAPAGRDGANANDDDHRASAAFEADGTRDRVAEERAVDHRGDDNAAARMLEDNRDLFLGAITTLAAGIANRRQLLHEAAALAAAPRDGAVLALVAVAVMAGFVGFVVWHRVYDAASALDRLTAAVQSIAEGGLAIDIPLQLEERRDEIGEMARVLVAHRDDLVARERVRADRAALDRDNLRRMEDVERRLSARAERLGAEVAQKTRDLAAGDREIIWRLSRATERRDAETGDHITRMARISGLVAEALGLSEEDCRLVELAAQMHDIGKVGIPDEILFKPGPLTAEERRVMEGHAMLGWDILKGSKSRLIQMAADVAVSHHERWDGQGYPHRLARTGIPLSGRIAALADVFDALTSARPYKAAWPLDDARAFIEESSGKHFDPACVAAFLSRWDDIVAVVNTSALQVDASCAAE